ncbi:hypothetical protein E8E14_000986 [Neopestalotiopsis sp. 37M]|nr:hypothetical protein E8E14_000986 [Neopestalotiopsis sp. 37M]
MVRGFISGGVESRSSFYSIPIHGSSVRGRQWISEGAGQRCFLENFDVFANSTELAPRPVSTISLEQSRELPPESTCRYFFEAFLESKSSIIFPILARGLFEETIARAYDAKASDLGRHASAKACIWAMTALVAPTTETQQSASAIKSEECMDEVRRLLVINNSTANLDSLQANLLLWSYQKTRGQCREAAITFKSASRTVCDLGGHFLPSRPVIVPQHIPTFDEQTRLHIRRLFWLCYCFDKDVSLGTNSPPLLTSEYCDVSGPREVSQQTPWYNAARDIDLAKIKENASRLLCSPRAFRYTEGELLAHVRQLDDQLEEWRVSIDPCRRPRLSIPSDSSFTIPSNMSVGERTHMINLQLDYLFTMINIHTMVRKCGDLEKNLPDDLHSVVHSSADLSIEASRSIFRFLHTVVDFWKEDAVWVVSHYAPMAAMPLFVNILIHPVGQPADSDLLILSSIGDITRNIPTARLSKDTIEQIQGIGEFVMELVRLGHSAAWKAKKGEREYDLDIIHP